MRKVFTVAMGMGVAGLLAASVCLASGGRVTLPDGTPVAGATVKIVKDGKDRVKLHTDQKGRFTLPDKKFKRATVQISVPGEKEYGTTKLPVGLFQGNELAVVLQKK